MRSVGMLDERGGEGRDGEQARRKRGKRREGEGGARRGGKGGEGRERGKGVGMGGEGRRQGRGGQGKSDAGEEDGERSRSGRRKFGGAKISRTPQSGRRGF